MKQIYSLEEWTKLSVLEVSEDNVIAAIHIDELRGYCQSKNLVMTLIDLLEEMSRILDELNTCGLSIFLFVDFLPKSIRPLKFIQSPSWIEQEIIPGSVPKIVVCKTAEPEFIPLTELHRTPLDKKTFGLKGNFNPFYKEDRILTSKKDKLKLNRELLFIYGNIAPKITSPRPGSYAAFKSHLIPIP